jgi:hypothetical protein
MKTKSVLLLMIITLTGCSIYQTVLNIYSTLGRKEGSSSNFKLVVQPLLGTPVGDLLYPEAITIEDHNFN